MGEFIRKFTQLNGETATIILDHSLFGQQKISAQKVQVIEDDVKLGLTLRGQAVFVYKDRLKSMELSDEVVEFADDKLRILIKFKKV